MLQEPSVSRIVYHLHSNASHPIRASLSNMSSKVVFLGGSIEYLLDRFFCPILSEALILYFLLIFST